MSTEVIVLFSVKKFIQNLEQQSVTKVAQEMTSLEEFGYKLTMPQSRRIGSNLYELRVRGKQEVRIFYTFKRTKALLFYGFVKKTRKIPQGELAKIYKILATL